MSRHLFKLFNLAKPTFKFAKSTITMSKPAKIGSLFASSSLFGLLYLKQTFQNPTFTDPDFNEVETINASELQEGDMKEVQVGPTKDDVILISKVNGKYYATGAKCTHFGMNLAKGILIDNKVICPLHAAAFNVVDGFPDEGPVFDGLATFDIKERDGKLVVKVPKNLPFRTQVPMVGRNENDSRKFVILGAGPAALSAAETLRQSGYGGEIIMVTNDDALPYDRTILTKNLFKVELPKINIRDQSFFDKYGITVLTNKNVKNVDTQSQTVEVEGLGGLKYDKLLVATGGRPRLPPIPGADLENVFTVRRFHDVEKIRKAAQGAKNVVIIGGSFIGMETAANFKGEFKDNVNITVVESAEVPFARALGKEIGNFYKGWYEQNGVKFALGSSVKAIEGSGSGKHVVLADGTKLPADLVVIGVGVRPNSEPVANSLQLANDGSIVADKYLKTSNDNVFAAGDVASFPYWYTGTREKIEHYNEAIQQGMIAAHNMLGKQISHEAIPFFWTRQFEKSLQYVGFGTKYDDIHIEGDFSQFNFLAYYGFNNKVVASASMGRSPAAMIISHAMQIGVMPSMEEIKSGKISVEDIKKRIQEKKGKSTCKRGNCLHKKAQEKAN